jgi:hypothetical protein
MTLACDIDPLIAEKSLATPMTSLAPTVPFFRSEHTASPMSVESHTVDRAVAVDAVDAEMIDTSTRLYWSDSPADTYRLMACSRADEMRVKMLRYSALTWTASGLLYRLAVL